jgi:hypothetical protein
VEAGVQQFLEPRRACAHLAKMQCAFEFQQQRVEIFRRRGLVEFQRQAVGIGEEGEAAACVFVGAQRLHRDALHREFVGGRLHVVHFEGQVPQAPSLGPRGSRRRIRKREQLDLRAVGQCQVELVRVARRAVVLGDHAQAEHLGVEALRHRVVGADDGGVMDAIELHGAQASNSTSPSISTGS